MTTFRCPHCQSLYGSLTTSTASTPPAPSVRWVVQRIDDGRFWSQHACWSHALGCPALYDSELEASRIWLIGGTRDHVRVRAVRQRPRPQRWEECSRAQSTATVRSLLNESFIAYLREIDPAPAGPWVLVEPDGEGAGVTPCVPPAAP
jgi:hypothetical protein